MELLALDFGLPLLLEFFIEIEMNLLTQSLDLLGVGPLLESAQLVGFNRGMGGEWITIEYRHNLVLKGVVAVVCQHGVIGVDVLFLGEI